MGNEKFRFLLVIIFAFVYISVSFYTLVKSPVVCCSVAKHGNIPHHPNIPNPSSQLVIGMMMMIASNSRFRNGGKERREYERI